MTDLKLALREQAPKVKTLDDLRAILNIGDDDWDYIIVGDGSGTQWQYAIGWASVMIARGGTRRAFYGGQNGGTNIMAEMMAYLHPLLWLAKGKVQMGTRVHIITDCEVVQTCGRRRGTRKNNRELWFLFDSFKHRGFLLQFHWIPRDTIELNRFSHTLANLTRVRNRGLAKRALQGKKMIQLNPSE